MLKFYIPILLCLVTLTRSDEGVNWVLLVAGSNEYYNYRHQVLIKILKIYF
jgi:glycosylphosphatidylinositol transamidase (GPIT) subunit GPI8